MQSVDMGGHAIAFTINAMVRYQQAAGETAFDALRAMDGGDFDPIRLRRLVWAALVDRSSDEDQAGEIIDRVGLKTASDALGRAVKAAFPDGDDAEKK